jgi:predicted Fe-Mo cluster-binding NifX family protein
MRIAVTYEGGKVFQHFGHTERFKIYDVEDGEVKLATVVNTDGSGHGALADILKKLEVKTLICGGIGEGARRALGEAGIELKAGVEGDADSAVRALLDGTLVASDSANCDHSGHHHGDGEGCGNAHRHGGGKGSGHGHGGGERGPRK